MVTRDEVIERWQSRLSETQTPPAGEVSPKAHWVRRVYARIYRFLLACYGQGQWQTQPSDRGELSSALGLKELPELEGQPPKRPAQISKVLKSLHGANAESASALPAGEWTATAYRKEEEAAYREAEETARNAWVSAARFCTSDAANRFVDLLAKFDIRSNLYNESCRYCVEVRRRDLIKAHFLFDENCAELQSLDKPAHQPLRDTPKVWATSAARKKSGWLPSGVWLLIPITVIAALLSTWWQGWAGAVAFAVIFGGQMLGLVAWSLLVANSRKRLR